MVREVAQIEIKPGHQQDFEAAVRQAVPLFEGANGCIGVRLHRSVEFPERYQLMVEWATLEDRTIHFRKSPSFEQWRSLVGAHFELPPEVEHLHQLPLGF